MDRRVASGALIGLFATGAATLATASSCIALVCFEDETCAAGDATGTGTGTGTADTSSSSSSAAGAGGDGGGGGEGDGGAAPCGGADLANDPANCGDCDLQCEAGGCSGGLCVPVRGSVNALVPLAIAEGGDQIAIAGVTLASPIMGLTQAALFRVPKDFGDGEELDATAFNFVIVDIDDGFNDFVATADTYVFYPPAICSTCAVPSIEACEFTSVSPPSCQTRVVNGSGDVGPVVRGVVADGSGVLFVSDQRSDLFHAPFPFGGTLDTVMGPSQIMDGHDLATSLDKTCWSRRGGPIACTTGPDSALLVAGTTCADRVAVAPGGDVYYTTDPACGGGSQARFAGDDSTILGSGVTAAIAADDLHVFVGTEAGLRVCRAPRGPCSPVVLGDGPVEAIALPASDGYVYFVVGSGLYRLQRPTAPIPMTL